MSTLLNPSIVRRRSDIQPLLRGFHVANVKTQEKVHYRFINGILDVSFTKSEGDFLEIVEIKASRQKEWTTMALLQAILYGMCHHQANFRIHLINVLSSSWKHYYVSFQKNLKPTLKEITNEIQIYNLNSFL